MGDISFSVQRASTSSPEMLWTSLKAGATSGWPILRECRELAVGNPVLFTLPHPDGGEIDSSGRIVRIEPGRSIRIAQESPWEGSTKLTLTGDDTGTSVRVDVTLKEDCLPWFLGNASLATVTASRSVTVPALKIGLLVSLSGAAGVEGRSVVNAAILAVEELNSVGAFGRRHAELVVADDRTSVIAARSAFITLADDERCDVVIAMITSASKESVRPLAVARGTLFLYAALGERGRGGPNFFQLGETPADQLWRSIPTIMRESDASNWYIVGNDYVWPRTVGMVANELIVRNNGRVAGERYEKLGTTDYDPVIDSIAASGADLILSSLVGLDAIKFERAFYTSGNRQEFTTLATLFDDAIADHIGPTEASGIWSVAEYFAPTLADEMDDVAARYRARFGELAPRLTSVAKSTYDVCNLYAQCVQVARSFEPHHISSALRSGAVGSSRLRSRVQGELTPTQAVEFTPTGFQQRTL